MSTQATGNPPYETINDGAVFAKIWRNVNEESHAWYNVSVGRIYTDSKSGEVRESRYLQGTDILKAEKLMGRAYDAIERFREQDRQQSQQNDQEQSSAQAQGLEAQRDEAQQASQLQTPEAGKQPRIQTPQR